MIKVVAKKGMVKATIMGERLEVAAQVAHVAVSLVEKLIATDKATGYATGELIMEELREIVPEKPKMGDEKKRDEDGEQQDGNQ